MWVGNRSYKFNLRIRLDHHWEISEEKMKKEILNTFQTSHHENLFIFERESAQCSKVLSPSLLWPHRSLFCSMITHSPTSFTWYSSPSCVSHLFPYFSCRTPGLPRWDYNYSYVPLLIDPLIMALPCLFNPFSSSIFNFQILSLIMFAGYVMLCFIL